MSGLYRRSKCLLSGIFCGNWNAPHTACSFQGAQVLSGRRNCIRSSRRSHGSRPKRAHNDKGSVSSHNSGMNRARISFQKELRTKLSSRHRRQRFKVLGSIFSISRMRRTRSGFRPSALAFHSKSYSKVSVRFARNFHIAPHLKGHDCPNLNSSILIWSVAIEKFSPSHSDCLRSVE